MANSRGNKERVLIVDPSRTMRRLIRSEFDPAEFDIFEAASGALAVNCAEENKPTLVTLSTVLTDGDGVDTCRRITELLKELESPIIVVTSKNAEQERALAAQYGVVHFIHKGFKPGALAEYAREILKPKRSLEGKRLLVVDDSPVPRACLRRSLGAQGATIVEAEDGRSALDLVTTQPFDLVITDQFMANMNGLDFMRIVRHSLNQDELPIILMSAATCHSVLTSALAGGANDFIRKPFEAVELLARVNNCLRASALSRRLQAAVGEAEYANRTKSAFFATMSHEIRTPLTAVIGYAEQLKDVSLTPEEREAAIFAIGRSGEQLVELIDEVNDYAKIESGNMSVALDDVSPLNLLLDLQKSMQVFADEKGLKLIVESVGPIPDRIRSDPVRLQQILENLVDNAVKYTSEGEIRVTMRFVSDERRELNRTAAPLMEFVVADTGIGIDSEKLQYVFEAFGNPEHSPIHAGGGIELGLAISRHCARMLGGNIVVKSEPDVGSVFTAFVATGDLTSAKWSTPDVPAEIRRRIAEENTGSGNKKPLRLQGRVLLADDAVFNQKLLQRILEKAGLHVTIVENGRDAADRAMDADRHGTSFHLILMDMQMPVLNGVDATRELRDRGFDGPIIALTASTSDEDREACMLAGCNDFLTKPIDKNRLLDVVGRFCPRGEWASLAGTI
ncbi:MAG: response regulator [Phycisphaerales bacterium]|nr:response regulator [Phycisphaerales bacterium]MCB9864464.1 response regulator [Phycisphaerales bacterium]